MHDYIIIGSGIAGLFTLNTFGAVTGCLGAGFVLMGAVGLANTVAMTAAVNVAIGTFLLLGRIVLIRPMSFALLTAVALGVAVAMGAFFVVGAFLFTLRTRWLIAIGALAALAAAGLQWWAFEPKA